MRYISCVLLSSVVPMPEGDTYAALAALTDESQKKQFAAETAYMRGEYEAVKAHYAAVDTADDTYLCAANIAICAAMSTRDYDLFKRIASSVEQIEKNADTPDMANTASLLRVFAQVNMHAPSLAPAWLVRGDFSRFSRDSLSMLMYMRVKYLQSVNDFSGMLAAAQTTLAFYARPDSITVMDIYFTCLCACACYALGRIDDMKEYLDKTISFCEPIGFVSPLCEYSACLGGFLELALKKAKPEFEKAVIEQIDKTLKNWLFFHNEFTRDNVPLMLTPKEFQLAVLLKEGKSYKQCADRLCLSLGRIRNLVTGIYEKLGISQKADIKRFIF